jgi:NADP-dependent 3-hydroxy acid dehydrogenase YdfG
MTTISGKVVAVTGAASGIGRALAQHLKAKGAELAIADRNAAGLAETAALLGNGTRVTQHVLDVRDRNAVEGFARAVKEQHGGADIIINNAGIASRATIEDCSYDDLELVIGVNLWGVIYGTKAFLPLLRERGAGHIVNIASINAIVPFPLNGPYNISKYGVYGLNETLMQELRGESIKIMSVHPGGVRTNIVRNSRHMGDRQVKNFAKAARTTPEKAARVIVAGIEHNRERVFVGADSKLMAAGKRLAPSWMVAVTGYLTTRIWA